MRRPFLPPPAIFRAQGLGFGLVGGGSVVTILGVTLFMNRALIKLGNVGWLFGETGTNAPRARPRGTTGPLSKHADGVAATRCAECAANGSEDTAPRSRPGPTGCDGCERDGREAWRSGHASRGAGGRARRHEKRGVATGRPDATCGAASQRHTERCFFGCSD